jgi:plasmid stabilization system protein ParE
VRSVEFAPAARAEFDAAADHYEQQRAGRGLRFVAAVERTVKLIVRFPEVRPLFPGVRSDLNVRRRVVRGFPFVLAYRFGSDKIRIDAVAHMHRRPGYWLKRVR